MDSNEGNKISMKEYALNVVLLKKRYKTSSTGTNLVPWYKYPPDDAKLAAGAHTILVR